MASSPLPLPRLLTLLALLHSVAANYPTFTAPAPNAILVPGHATTARWNLNGNECELFFHVKECPADLTHTYSSAALMARPSVVTSGGWFGSGSARGFTVPKRLATSGDAKNCYFAALQTRRAGGVGHMFDHCGNTVFSRVFYIAGVPDAPAAKVISSPHPPGDASGDLQISWPTPQAHRSAISHYVVTVGSTRTGFVTQQLKSRDYRVSVKKWADITVTVAAVNAIGSSANTTLQVTNLITVPSSPKTVTISGVTQTTATVAWGPPADAGGLPVTDYTVSVTDTTTGSVVQTHTIKMNPPPMKASTELTGLPVGAELEYRVQACNSQGCSVPANHSSATHHAACSVHGCSAVGGLCAAPCGEVEGTCTCTCQEGWGTTVDDPTCASIQPFLLDQIFLAQVDAWNGNRTNAMHRLEHLTLDLFPLYVKQRAANTDMSANLTLVEILDSGAADSTYSLQERQLFLQAYQSLGNLADGHDLNGHSATFVYPETWQAYSALLGNWEKELTTLDGHISTISAEGFDLSTQLDVAKSAVEESSKNEMNVQMQLHSLNSTLIALSSERQKMQDKLMSSYVLVAGDLSGVIASMKKKQSDLAAEIKAQRTEDKENAAWNMLKDGAQILGPLILAAATDGASLSATGEDTAKELGQAALGCAVTKLTQTNEALGKGASKAQDWADKKLKTNFTKAAIGTGWHKYVDQLQNKEMPDPKKDAGALCDMYDQFKSWRNDFKDDPVIVKDEAEMKQIDSDLEGVEQFMSFINNLQVLELATIDATIETLPSVIPAMHLLKNAFSDPKTVFPKAFSDEIVKEANANGAGAKFASDMQDYLGNVAKYIDILQAWVQQAQSVQTVQLQSKCAGVRSDSALALLEKESKSEETLAEVRKALQEQQLMVWGRAQWDLQRMLVQARAFQVLAGLAEPLDLSDVPMSATPDLTAMQNVIAQVDELQNAVVDGSNNVNRQSQCWIKYELQKDQYDIASPEGMLFTQLQDSQTATLRLPLPDSTSFYAVQYDQVVAYMEGEEMTSMTYIEMDDLGTSEVLDEQHNKHITTYTPVKHYFNYNERQCAMSHEVVDDSYILNTPYGFWQLTYATGTGAKIENISKITMYFHVYYRQFPLDQSGGRVVGFWGSASDASDSSGVCMSIDDTSHFDPKCKPAPAPSTLAMTSSSGELLSMAMVTSNVPEELIEDESNEPLEDPMCLEDNCSSHGLCDLATGQCQCNTFYTGSDCSVDHRFVTQQCEANTDTSLGYFIAHDASASEDDKQDPTATCQRINGQVQPSRPTITITSKVPPTPVDAASPETEIDSKRRERHGWKIVIGTASGAVLCFGVLFGYYLKKESVVKDTGIPTSVESDPNTEWIVNNNPMLNKV